jgi:hypothetical protein
VGHCGAVGALDWGRAAAAAAVDGSQEGRRRSTRGLSSGKEMLWKRRAATSKQDHRAAVRRVLRPGVMLWIPAGAGNDGEGVMAGGRLRNLWRARGRAAGEGNRAGAGGERRVDVIRAGGGAASAAERRPGAKHYWRQCDALKIHQIKLRAKMFLKLCRRRSSFNPKTLILSRRRRRSDARLQLSAQPF